MEAFNKPEMNLISDNSPLVGFLGKDLDREFQRKTPTATTGGRNFKFSTVFAPPGPGRMLEKPCPRMEGADPAATPHPPI